NVLEQQRVGVRGVPAHLVVAGAGGEPGGVGGDDDAAQLRAGAAVGTGAPPGDGGDGDQGGDRGAGVGDELLGPPSTHCPSSSRAVVRVPPASEPASASVSPKAASSSPRARAGRYRCFWASVPK